MKRAIFLLFALGALVSGTLACGTVSTPTPTLPPPPTLPPTPTPTPFPVQAPGWGEVTVHTLCLEVEQSYLEIEGKSPEPIAETVRRILARVGLQVVAEGAPCDATLTLTLTGWALGTEYMGGAYCYTGAEVSGEMLLTVPGHASLTLPVSAIRRPLGIIAVEDCHREAIDAPFEEVWSEALFGGLAQLWGPQVPIQALGDENEDVRAGATRALGKIGSEAIPALVQALGNEDKNVHEAAAKALGAIGPEAVPALIQAMGDEDEVVRRAAAEAVGWIGQEAVEAIPPLIQALEDEDSSVRWAAAVALGNIGPEEGVVPALIQALEDENSDVRKVAAGALERIGPEAVDAVPALIQALEDESVQVRKAAVGALGGIGPEEGVVLALTQALEDEHADVRWAAIKALERIGPEEGAVPALIQALGDEERQVRKAAAGALETITGQDFGEDADRWQEWWEKQ